MPTLDTLQDRIKATITTLRELNAAVAKEKRQQRLATQAAAIGVTFEQAKTMSRQRLWQLVKHAQGLCGQCGCVADDGRRECISCAARHTGNVPKRHVLPQVWAQVSWDRPTADIAKELEVSLATVYKYQPLQFRRPRGRPQKVKAI